MSHGLRLGIDIGGTKTAAAILHPDGTLAALRTAASGYGPGEVLGVATELAREALGTVDPGLVEPVAGACMPGLVDPVAGTVRHAVNLGIEVLDLQDGLQRGLGLQFSVENDVKAAALGADRLLRQRSMGQVWDTVAYLNIGTGLAAAIVHRGRVLRGPDGVVGEIGHLPVGGAVPCTCGQVGCLETIASGSALQRLWPAEHRGGDDPFAAARAGDEVARRAGATLCRGIGLALQTLVLTSGAQRIVIGGGLASLGPALEEGLRTHLGRAAAASDFVASLNLGTRFELLPSEVPVAVLGAALLPHRGPAASWHPDTWQAGTGAQT